MGYYPQNVPFDGIGNIDEEPNFISEADYHLSAGSPCIDAGTNDANYVTEVNDIEGSARIIDGDSNGIATADMGAYEYDTNEPVIAVWADRLVCLTNADNEVKGKIYIKNAGTGTLNYEIVSDNDWLTLNNPIGASSGEIVEVNVSIDGNSLDLGDYHCLIKVYSNEAINSGTEYFLNVHIGTLWTVLIDVNTIQSAIDAASDYDCVCIMDGNYTGTGNRDVNFAGKNIMLYSSSSNPENCIINCENAADGFKLVSHESEVFINDISILNAKNKAVICDACASPTITNCIFTSTNYAVYVQNYCSLKISNCRYSPTCVYSDNSNKIYIDNCRTINTKYGQIISMGDGEKLIVKNCDVASLGGAISCIYTKKVIIDNCKFYGGRGSKIYFMSIGEFEISNTEMKNNKVVGSFSGTIVIRCTGKGKILNCVISKNNGDGIYTSLPYEDVVVENCLLAGNNNGCRISGYEGRIKFINCTFNGNRKSILYYLSSDAGVSFKNCILWDSTIAYSNKSPVLVPDISYCDVKGGWDGIGNIDTDPCFVEPGYWDANGTPSDANDDFWIDGDYHLKSFGWRWDADANEWTFDRITSRCIDAGSPGYPLGGELLAVPDDPDNEWGENLRIDMGCYGGTVEASMPPYDWALLGDMDNSGRVNFIDYSYLSGFYGLQDEKLDGDLNRDGQVDLGDVNLLADDWLCYTDWALGR